MTKVWKSSPASLGTFVVAVLTGLLFHTFVIYPILLVFFAKRNPFGYFANVVPAICTMLGVSSSAATLPKSIECAHANGIAPQTANFVLSLGATINMDGSCIHFICTTVFLGALQGITFSIGDYFSMALLATFCSMGAAPIPSSGLVLIVTIMAALGVPFNSTFGIITAVDWLLNRFRGCVNIMGDATVAAIINDRFDMKGDAGEGGIDKMPSADLL